MREINLQVLIQNLNLEVVLTSDVLPNISVSDLNRPGLELTGYFDYFAYDRIQILGKTEISFLESLSSHLRTTRLEKLLSYDIPCLIVTRNLNTPNELVSIARKNKKPILRTHTATTQFMSRLTNLLERELALRTTVHGVLVEIYGIGVLIIGESGIGKSETAIELIERGHRLVADDVVDIKQVAQDILIGTAPELIRHYLEVRGLGIIDVKTIFGAKSIRDNIKIEMVIELVEWKDFKEDNRLGLDDEKMQVLDSNIAKRTIPVRPGRNIATIIEVATMDYRLKALGYNAALEFSKKVFNKINQK